MRNKFACKVRGIIIDKYFSEIWHLIDVAEGSEEGHNDSLSLILKSTGWKFLSEKDINEASYMRAYCLYAIGDKDTFSEIEKLLTSVDADSKSYVWAQQYLAYLFFDEMRYEESMLILSKFKCFEKLAFSQRWRYLKNHELYLCCMISCSQSFEKEWAKFKQLYLSFEEDDRPIIFELLGCCERLQDSNKDLTDIINWIEKIENDQ